MGILFDTPADLVLDYLEVMLLNDVHETDYGQADARHVKVGYFL